MKNILFFIVISFLLVGCMTTETIVNRDIRRLDGQLFFNEKTGRSIVPKYVGDNLYILNETYANGEISYGE